MNSNALTFLFDLDFRLLISSMSVRLHEKGLKMVSDKVNFELANDCRRRNQRSSDKDTEKSGHLCLVFVWPDRQTTDSFFRNFSQNPDSRTDRHHTALFSQNPDRIGTVNTVNLAELR